MTVPYWQRVAERWGFKPREHQGPERDGSEGFERAASGGRRLAGEGLRGGLRRLGGATPSAVGKLVRGTNDRDFGGDEDEEKKQERQNGEIIFIVGGTLTSPYNNIITSTTTLPPTPAFTPCNHTFTTNFYTYSRFHSYQVSAAEG